MAGSPSDVTYSEFPLQKPCRTKIIATVGPACEQEEMLRELILAGVDLFRINFAHNNISDAGELVRRIRKVSAALEQPIGILADLAGPKMRLGELPGGTFDCQNGMIIEFVREDDAKSGIPAHSQRPVTGLLRISRLETVFCWRTGQLFLRFRRKHRNIFYVGSFRGERFGVIRE